MSYPLSIDGRTNDFLTVAINIESVYFDMLDFAFEFRQEFGDAPADVDMDRCFRAWLLRWERLADDGNADAQGLMAEIGYEACRLNATDIARWALAELAEQ